MCSKADRASLIYCTAAKWEK